jgi:hypothetical protein
MEMKKLYFRALSATFVVCLLGTIVSGLIPETCRTDGGSRECDYHGHVTFLLLTVLLLATGVASYYVHYEDEKKR